MPDIKFACLNCNQHIQAEPGYAGLQINCPACHAPLTVPGTPVARAVAVPVAAAAPMRAVPVFAGATTARVSPAGATITHAPANPWATPWYKTLYPYLGLLFATLGLLYYMGRQNPDWMVACGALAGLFSLAAHIIVVVSAFKEGAGTGFLTLCVPFYALYYVFAVNQSSTLRLLYCTAVITNLIVRFLPS